MPWTSAKAGPSAAGIFFEKQPILEEALLAETEALFRRWSRRVPATQRPRLDRTESEVMDLLRGLVRDLDASEGGT